MQPDYKIPYSANFAVGMTHDFGQRLSVRADYVHTRTYDANIGPDTNWTCRTPTAPTRGGIRATPTSRWSATADRSGTTGSSRGSSYRLSPTARAGLSYTLSKTRSNTSTGLSTGGTTNPFDLDEDLGPDDNDRRHNLVVDASYLVPKIDVQFAGISTYRSALPYSVSTSFQLDADPFSDRPEPRGSRRDGAGKKHRPAGEQDLPASAARRTATAFWEMFNVFNVDNWLRYQGSLQSTSVRPGADRGSEAAPAARVPVRFLAT